MAELNVFQLTNQVLRDTTSKTEQKKSVKESVRKTSKKKVAKIPANKLKIESLTMFKEEEEVEVDDYTPEDDIVIVVDPEMDEVPEDTEEAEKAAEELIGDHVCKCSICGANYVTDEDLTEDLEIEDSTCPVCGEEGEQIVVGVITPTEELSAEDEEDLDDVEVEEEETVEVEDDGEEVSEEEFSEEDEEFGESVKRARMRSAKRRAESVKRAPLARKTVSKRPRTQKTNECAFDEVTLNRMLTRFAKENYSNVKFVKISKGIVRGSKLTLEGVVTTTKGSKRPIKFVCENYKESARMTLRFKENGPFTESVKSNNVTFIVECVMRKGTIIPTVLKYSFKAKDFGTKKESRSTYSVTGKVLSEDVRRRK